MSKNNAVYIMTNYTNTTFYIGVTNNLFRRIQEYKTKAIEGFTSRYNIKKLVYFELTDNIEDALNREKQLKNWKRQWKIDLVKKDNPEFKDLSYDIGYTDPESSSG